MKLSISTEALERLLGGDTELEIELRHQVAKQFTKAHLLPLVNSETFKEAVEKQQEHGGHIFKLCPDGVVHDSYVYDQIKPEVLLKMIHNMEKE